MTNTAWDHLPNAAHIDRVLAHVRANPQKWAAASDAASDAAWDAAWIAAWVAVWGAAWSAARDAVLDAARDAVYSAVRGAVRDAVRGAAWDAVLNACLALSTWDEAGELVGKNPQQLKALSDEGVHAAALLLPASIAMEDQVEGNNK